MAKQICWWQAADIFGIPDHSMRHWKQRYSAMRILVLTLLLQGQVKGNENQSNIGPDRMRRRKAAAAGESAL